MYSQTLVPAMVSKTENKLVANFIAVAGGVILLTLLAKITIPLSWTPVPITGQTFGVSLVSLLWGWKRGGTVVLFYLALGAAGFGVFATVSGGATLGYLAGMFLASVLVGSLVDRGFTNTYAKTLLAAYIGSAVIFTCGLIGLSFYLPIEALLVSGVLPFLPGDLVKNLIASGIAFSLNKKS